MKMRWGALAYADRGVPWRGATLPEEEGHADKVSGDPLITKTIDYDTLTLLPCVYIIYLIYNELFCIIRFDLLFHCLATSLSGRDELLYGI